MQLSFYYLIADKKTGDKSKASAVKKEPAAKEMHDKGVQVTSFSTSVLAHMDSTDSIGKIVP